MIFLLIILLFYIVSPKVFYLSDIRHPISKCEIDFLNKNNSISHYSLNNIMGSVIITSDPFGDNLILKIFLSRYFNDDNQETNEILSSCELCRLNNSFCNKKINIIFSQDVLINFRISVKREGYGNFNSDIENLKTKFRLSSSSFGNDLTSTIITIPLDQLLSFNNDSINELTCDDNLDIVFQLIVSTKNLTLQRDFILVPFDIENLHNNKLCIPNEEYLSLYDCTQSNVYRVIKYKIENCLIPKKKTVIKNDDIDNFLKNSLGIFNDSEKCSINNNFYYDSLFFHNKLNKDLLDFKICNETIKSIFEKSIYDEINLIHCETLISDCDVDYEKKIIKKSILLKPFYRLLKQTIITLLNYMDCLSKNNTRIIEIDKLLYRSIGILKNSCYFKNYFDIDLEEYQNSYNNIINFNNKGNDHCSVCDHNNSLLNLIKCKDQLFYCKFIIENFDNYSKVELTYWYNHEIYHLKGNDNIVNNTEYRFGEIFGLFLDESQFGIEATILFLFLFIIGIISIILIISLISQKLTLKIIENRNK